MFRYFFIMYLREKGKKEDGAEGEKYTTAARISGDSQQNGCFDGVRNDCGAGME